MKTRLLFLADLFLGVPGFAFLASGFVFGVSGGVSVGQNLLIFLHLESTLNLHIKLCVKAPGLTCCSGHFPMKVGKFQK